MMTCRSIFQLKMPQSVGTKKAKAVEQLLDELGVGMFSSLQLISYIRLPPPIFKDQGS